MDPAYGRRRPGRPAARPAAGPTPSDARPVFPLDDEVARERETRGVGALRAAAPRCLAWPPALHPDRARASVDRRRGAFPTR